jgi:hypothetical protein
MEHLAQPELRVEVLSTRAQKKTSQGNIKFKKFFPLTDRSKRRQFPIAGSEFRLR